MRLMIMGDSNDPEINEFKKQLKITDFSTDQKDYETICTAS